MIDLVAGKLKALIARFWPAFRLRTLIFGTLLFVVILPGIGALFLRVYENSLLRQTEAELVAQSAVLVATAQVLSGDVTTINRPPKNRIAIAEYYHPEGTTVDLRLSEILESRPKAHAAKETLLNPIIANLSKSLPSIMATTSKTTLASIQLVDANGVVRIGFDTGKKYSNVMELTTALSGKPITILRRNASYKPRYSFEWLSRASNLRLHHARPLTVDGQTIGAILITRSPRALFRGLYEDRGKILLGIAVIFGLLIIITAVLARAIVKPVERLSAAARAVSAGHGTIPKNPSLPVVEIDQLYQNFREMAETIERRSHYLRDLAAAVSHEFKTPLTGIKGAVELMEDHGDDMDAADRQRFLNNIDMDAERLSQLVGRLMELANADMQLPDHQSQTDIAKTLLKIIDSFQSEGYRITTSFPDDPLTAQTDMATVEVVATTLLENSKQAGAHHITVKVKGEDDHIIVDFCDDGPGIPSADIDNIFNPFFTSKREVGGTGLGLAIARSLVSASKGGLRFQQSDSGAHFQLKLKRTGS